MEGPLVQSFMIRHVNVISFHMKIIPFRFILLHPITLHFIPYHHYHFICILMLVALCIVGHTRKDFSRPNRSLFYWNICT